MVYRSTVTNFTSPVPFSIDWEGDDHDEVFTRRRVVTPNVESGVPKHFSSESVISHSGQSRTQQLVQVCALVIKM